jgi:hypothetical protein
MSLLSDLFEEACQDVIQEDWDLTLISIFRAVKFPRTSFVVENFRGKHKLSDDDFFKLKRVPRYQRHFHCSIRRFIAAYLPHLNDRLLDTKMSDDELLAWMRRSKLDTQDVPEDAYKVHAETRERRKARLLMQADRTQYRQADLNNKAHGRGWTTIKAVRSKT